MQTHNKPGLVREKDKEINFIFRVIGRYKALIDYIGDPNPGRGKPVLKFKKDMIIDVSYKDTEWWKGRTDGNEGWFPAHLVEEFKQVGNKI